MSLKVKQTSYQKPCFLLEVGVVAVGSFMMNLCFVPASQVHVILVFDKYGSV
jgi:hypothetical protein